MGLTKLILFIFFTVFQNIAYAKMGFLCPDDNCSSNGDPITGIIVLILLIGGLLFGQPKTRLLIVLIVGIPVLLGLLVDPIWVIAIFPMFIISMFVSDPIAKMLGIPLYSEQQDEKKTKVEEKLQNKFSNKRSAVKESSQTTRKLRKTRLAPWN